LLDKAGIVQHQHALTQGWPRRSLSSSHREGYQVCGTSNKAALEQPAMTRHNSNAGDIQSQEATAMPPNGHIYKRGNIYWIKYYRRGKPSYESTN
jgi:hypothetical protein